jgi:hypothetical protein
MQTGNVHHAVGIHRDNIDGIWSAIGIRIVCIVTPFVHRSHHIVSWIRISQREEKRKQDRPKSELELVGEFFLQHQKWFANRRDSKSEQNIIRAKKISTCILEDIHKVSESSSTLNDFLCGYP